ncbi:MAG: lytic transglycosylase domain-containing protein [Desulfovibrio sp.]|jgi:soluble lytic murein transglycosylase-like protein|nr:lytic transglycosylase domain-containing protein [Desulfovibrio sp.]
MIRCLLLVLLLVPAPVLSGTARDREALFEAYFDESCALYQVPKYLALAIARQESGMHPWIINVSGKDVRPETWSDALRVASAALRAGRSFDVGIMQINVYWLKKYDIPLQLALNPRINIQIGVWILANELRRHGNNWKAIAYYHTPLHKNPERGRAYAASVVNLMKRIMEERG